MRRMMLGGAALLVLACGSEVFVGGGEGGTATVPTIEPTCEVRVETTGIVDGEGVAREDCLATFGFPVPEGPTYYLEYWLDTGSQPLFLGEGEPISSDGVPAALDVGIFEAVQPLATDQPLCAGPGSTIVRRDFDSDDNRVELHLESLSRLGRCTPGDETVVIDPVEETVASSFGTGGPLLRLDSSVPGQLRIFYGDFESGEGYSEAGYAFVDADLEFPAAPGAYAITRGFVYDRGEVFCAGEGTVTIGSDPDPEVSPIEEIAITGLGSSGTCPGEPVEGFVDIVEINDNPFF